MTAKIEISKENLIEFYINQNLSTHKIAKLFHCDPSVIQKRLKENKILLRHPKKKIAISKEKLEDLYTRKRFSTQKIAKLLKISSCAVYYKLKELNIEPRKKNLIITSKKELEDLYLRKSLSISRIAENYNCCNTLIFDRLNKYGIKTRNLFEANIKYKKLKFNGDKNLKSYMIGFRLGDLMVKAQSDEATVIIKSCTTKEEQLNLIKEIYGKYGRLWIKNYENVISITGFLDKSFNFLVKKEDKIEDWIMQGNECFLSFLAGYTDAEGSFGVYNKAARFRVGSYDKNILNQIKEKLTAMGLKVTFNMETPAGKHNQNQDFYRTSISEKRSLLEFIKLMKPLIKHTKRYNDMLRCENNILERNKKQENKTIL